MARRRASPLGSLHPSVFLKRHWQKQPLLIRDALPSFIPPVDKSLLIELATQPSVEARVVQERAKPRWRVDHGPFERRFFQTLPKTHWTLLVQDLDKHLMAASTLLERFDFVPNWRVDDVMASHAAPHGSVGPHFDNYDVFLLQARGTRHWRLTRRYDPSELLEGTELRILRRFEAEQEITVEPGNMLYLPPGVAHHGVAREESLTLSIGFRAPSQRDLAFPFVEELLQRAQDELRYTDGELRPPRHRGRIDARALARIKRLLAGGLSIDPLQVERWFGRYVTEPKPNLMRQRAGMAFAAAELRRRGKLSHALGSRWAYFVSGETYLYVDGVEHRLPKSLEPLAALLCDRVELSAAQLEAFLDDPRARRLLSTLTRQGLLVVGD